MWPALPFDRLVKHIWEFWPLLTNSTQWQPLHYVEVMKKNPHHVEISFEFNGLIYFFDKTASSSNYKCFKDQISAYF